MSRINRMFAGLLVLFMLIGIVPVTVLAEQSEANDTFYTTEEITGELVVSGAAAAPYEAVDVYLETDTDPADFYAAEDAELIFMGSCTHASKTEEPYKEPECEEPGNNQYYICDLCGVVLKADGTTETTVEAETIAPMGHNYYKWYTPPTCATEGYYTYYCYNCGEEFVSEYVPVDPYNHIIEHWVMLEIPTDEAPGLIEGICTSCGITQQREYRYSISASPIVSLTRAFNAALGLLDMFYYLNAAYMIRIVNDVFCEQFYYGEMLTIPASLYEAVLGQYFIASEENIQAIRNYDPNDAIDYGSSYLRYNEADQTYTISGFRGGVGGILPEREYLGYVVNGNTYDVFYSHVTYSYLYDALPDDVDEWDYAEELGWPDTIEYNGVVYKLYGLAVGYMAASIDPYGLKYTVEINDTIVRILSCEEYTEEDLPERFEPAVTYRVPDDGSVSIPDKYYINDCFEDGTVVTIEQILSGQSWESVMEAMGNRAEKYVAYTFTATKDGNPVHPVGSLEVYFRIPADYSTNLVVYYLDESGRLREPQIYVNDDEDTLTVYLDYLGTYILAGTERCTHASKTEEPYKEPECEEPGNNQYYICDLCGVVLKADGTTETTVEAETIAPIGHDYSYERYTPPTCTTEGYYSCFCYNCDETFVREYVPVDPDSHILRQWVMLEPPADDVPGLVESTCEGCGVTQRRNYWYSYFTYPSVSLSAKFQQTLNVLDIYYQLDAAYMIRKVNDVFCQGFEYDETLVIPASLYEAVLDQLFVASEENIQAIRNYDPNDAIDYESSYLQYNAEDQTYTISGFYGGGGGITPEREYLGYVVNGNTYDVFYSHVTYTHLNDALPDGVDVWDYVEELGWPDTIEYNGVVYELYSDGYMAASIDPYGLKYTVEINDTIVRILSCEEYTEEDLPDRFEPAVTYRVPNDGSVSIPDKYYINDCFEDGTVVSIEQILAGQPFEEVMAAMRNVAVKYVAYTFTASKNGEPVNPVGGLEVNFRFPADYSANLIVYYLDENGKLRERQIYVNDDMGTLTVDLDNTGTYILADKDTSLAYYDWEFSDGILTISGVGALPNYDRDTSTRPWTEYIDQITSVVIEEGITNLGEYTFMGHYNLQAISLPASLEDIGYHEWHNNTLLQQITVAEDNTVYASLDGVLFNKDMTTLLLYPVGRTAVNYIIPDTVTKIANSAFENAEVKYVEIPEGVTIIENYAFYNTTLQSIVLPASLTELGDGAFAFCQYLWSVTFLGDVPAIKENSFADVTATAFHPAGNTTWTEDAKQSFGGELQWQDDTWETTITEQSGDLTVTEGAWGTMSLRVVGMGIRVQWEFLAPGTEEWSDYYPGNVATVSMVFRKRFYMEENGTQFRCKVTDLYGNVFYSNVVTLTVVPRSKLENMSNAQYALSDLVVGEDNVYRTPDGAKVYIAVANYADGGITDWLGGNTLYDYVAAYGSDYFDLTHWENLLALMDDAGYVELTEESLGYLISVTTGNPAWGETEAEVVYYLFYDHPENVPHEHTYTSVVTDPTCTAQGYTTYTCSGCGASYITDYVSAVGHTYVDGECACGAKEELKALLGDVNGDDKIDTTDAKLIMQFDLGIIDEIALELSAADVNGDGKVDTTDAKLIMQFDLGMITDFPEPSKTDSNSVAMPPV